MKKVILAVFFVMFVVSAFGSSDAGTDMYVNSSEPAFLRDIGPRDPRVDNPVAAGITVLGVAGMLYIGFNEEEEYVSSG